VSFGREAPPSALNRPLSPFRHLASCRRSLGELRQVKSRFGTTVNDVVLAVTSGAVRRHQERHGEQPSPLKAMVPVNVRDGAQAAELGNRISFMWVDLPCDEADPVARLQAVSASTGRSKREREPQGTWAALRALDYMPRAVGQAVSHLFASPRTSNIVVSNIPGPPMPVYLLGCELEELYPIVPLTEFHTVSVALFTVNDRACFSVYADRAALHDSDLLARDIEEEVEELLAAAARAGGPSRSEADVGHGGGEHRREVGE
jgi:WS/DGAT/MGAT family acyltransferase